MVGLDEHQYKKRHRLQNKIQKSLYGPRKQEIRNHHKYTPLHKYKHEDHDDYTDIRRKQIQTVYIVFAIIWIILSYIFYFYCGNVIIYLFFSIPLLVFGFNFHLVPQQTLSTTSLMFSADFLSIGFLIVTVIINWYREVDKKVVFGLVVLTVIILGFSTIDIWTADKDFIIIQHIRSSLETIAVVILIITVYRYYLEVQKVVYERNDPFEYPTPKSYKCNYNEVCAPIMLR